jgi:hypothetical protein
MKGENKMEAIIIIMMICVGFFAIVGLICTIIDFAVDLENARRELDKKCADRKRATEELLEIRRNQLED